MRVCYVEHKVTETISVPLDEATKLRLDALATQSQRSSSALAAEAIAAYVEVEEWQLEEIRAGIADLDRGGGIPHEAVSKWLRSWGTENELPAPKCRVRDDS